MTSVRAVGLLDSGIGADFVDRVVAGRSFAFDSVDGVAATEEIGDVLGHGSEVARVIAERDPACRFLVARVFHDRFVAQPHTVAAGLDWLVAGGARLVNMSFGLGADRAVLRESVDRALAAGTILVASAPALGKKVYPALYAGVISVTGDARCTPGVVSDLGGDRADFGTYCGNPRRGDEQSVIAGASVAAAHFSGLVAALLGTDAEMDRGAVVAHFRTAAHFGEDPRRRDYRTR